MTTEQVVEVLNGHRAYDELDTDDQAVVRAEWTERLEARLVALDLGGELAGEGKAYAELDEEGTVVVRRPPFDESTGTG